VNENIDESPERVASSKNGAARSDRPKRFHAAFVLTFFILFALWIVFSGRFDAFHLILGLVSCLIVSIFCHDFLFTTRNPSARGLIGLWFRFLIYIPWLLYQIFIANLRVMYLVCHPRMRELIDPHIIYFNSRLKSDYSRTTFANSITLTPGTITVNVMALGRFSVHCIDKPSGESLPGEMEERIAKVFGE
jgi:multicomponent Na+:H+ antiporter subunit E